MVFDPVVAVVAPNLKPPDASVELGVPNLKPPDISVVVVVVFAVV